MAEETDLFKALASAAGRRDGDFVRALAELVDAGELLLEPDVEYEVPQGDVMGVNMLWGLWLPNDWLAKWIETPASLRRTPPGSMRTRSTKPGFRRPGLGRLRRPAVRVRDVHAVRRVCESMTRRDDEHVVEVSISGGNETIRVALRGDGITIDNGDRWRQRLTREEAWRLAEALDEVATQAPDEA